MSHYFDEHPEVGSDRATVTLTVGDRLLTLATDRGVFSRGEIDAGTAVLLRKAPAPPADRPAPRSRLRVRADRARAGVRSRPAPRCGPST